MTRNWAHFDPVLLVLTIFASVLGIFCIFDAGYARSVQAGHGVVPGEIRSQVICFVVAAVAFVGSCTILPQTWRKLSKAAWFVSLLTLILVKKFGHGANGGDRWFMLGPVSVQPSEFAKIALVIYLAGLLSNRPRWPKSITPRKDLPHWLDTIAVPKLCRCMPAVWTLAGVALIELEPDLGTAAVLAVVGFALFAAGGVSVKSLLAGLIAGALCVSLVVLKEPYRVERITHHASRWSASNVDDSGYQTVQSEISQAWGGTTGVGIGAGRAKHVLPETTSDFILATVGEEFGLLGILVVLGTMGGLVWRLMWQSMRVQNRFGSLVLFGVAVWIGIQTCVNVMMANGALPPIGIPLPFISAGGSSLVALWIAMGVCQSVLAPVVRKEEAIASSGDRWGHRRAYLSGA